MGIFILINFVFVPENGVERCIEVNRAAGFIYDVCYDSISNNIFMLVDGGVESFEFDSFNVSFFDSQFRRYELIYRDVNMSQLYKFRADKNPGFINLTLNVYEKFEFPICEEPRRLAVKDCLARIPGWGEGSLNGSVIEERVPMEGPSRYNISDFADIEVKEEIWKSFCKSEWECSEWEECVDGLQHRNCVDLNKCAVSLNPLKTVRFCEKQCLESWVCNWSECIDGFTTPNCFDKNNCGTSFIFPPKTRCFFEEECRPRIRCDDWVGCDVDYSLFDLLEGNVEDLKGFKSRVCRDLNGCVEPLRETKECALSVDIYTSRFVECGEEFVGVYNALDNSLIARISEGTDEDPYLNIYLDEGEGDKRICEYCFDGVLDGDEEGIDCGGSCEKCSPEIIEKKGFWKKILDFFRWY